MQNSAFARPGSGDGCTCWMICGCTGGAGGGGKGGGGGMDDSRCACSATAVDAGSAFTSGASDIGSQLRTCQGAGTLPYLPRFGSQSAVHGLQAHLWMRTCSANVSPFELISTHAHPVVPAAFVVILVAFFNAHVLHWKRYLTPARSAGLMHSPYHRFEGSSQKSSWVGRFVITATAGSTVLPSANADADDDAEATPAIHNVTLPAYVT